ncbi:MAG: RidA family protein [Solirubrobacterales bacterium]
MAVKYSNPESMGAPIGAYSHVATGTGKLVSVAGQVGLDGDGNVAEGDLKAQMAQTFANLTAALESEGIGLSDVLAFTTYLIDADDIARFFEARTELFPELFPSGEYPPNTLLVIDRLVKPEFLIEISALAVA